MIKFKLKELLDQKEKTMYWLSKETGIRPNTISQWVNNEELEEDKKVKSISIDTLDRLCKTLDCKVQELIEYIK